MNIVSLLIASLIGAVVTTALSNVPYLNLVNCLLCAGFWVGAIGGLVGGVIYPAPRPGINNSFFNAASPLEPSDRPLSPEHSVSCCHSSPKNGAMKGGWNSEIWHVVGVQPVNCTAAPQHIQISVIFPFP